MRESRLFKILYHLLEKGNTTALELADKFEVSVRTVYRDIDVLSAAGIPVYAEPGRNGGIRLMDHFTLNRALLSEEEKQEVLTALQSLSAAKGIPDTDTQKKLAALFHMDTENWLEVDFSRWESSPRDNEKFQCIKSAILEHRTINITYAGSYNVVTERTLQPLKLSYKSRAWYLKAFCTKRQDFRLFKLSRIIDWKILEENFIPRQFPEETEIQPDNYPKITLRFPGKMAYRVYDEFDSASVKQLENGDLIASSRMPGDDWLIGYLLSFMGNVEVLEPVELKQALAKAAKRIYEQNKV